MRPARLSALGINATSSPTWITIHMGMWRKAIDIAALSCVLCLTAGERMWTCILYLDGSVVMSMVSRANNINMKWQLV